MRGLGPGEAIRIFTGAPMPDGADTVFMQEDTRVEGDAVIVPPGLKRGANSRAAGEDLRAGSVMLPAGRRLTTSHVALAAAVGLTALPVRRRVRVAVFSTGDEIVADDKVKLAHAMADAAATHDLVLTSGGVSTGEADHVRGAVESIGKLVFWRVGIKPGRPVAMGVIAGARDGEGAAFVGLPGNPVAVFVTFARVVRPLLLRLGGAEVTPLIPLPVRASFPYKKRSGRREYVRVRLKRNADGTVDAFKHAQDGAGVITSLTETDGLIELPEDVTTVAPGTTVGFLSYAALAE
jgi:molybdopterin molybdotransferase